MKKKLLLLLITAICVMSLPMKSIFAEEQKDSSYLIEEFISNIEKKNGKALDRSNMDIMIDKESDQISLLVDNQDESFTVYSSLSKADTAFLETKPSQKVIAARGIISTIIGIVTAVIRNGKRVCKVIEYISGGDVCGHIGLQLLQSMAKEKPYKATSVLYKDPSCAPSHSSQCNSYPNAYWETKLVRV